MSFTHGPRATPPPGFEEILDFCGRRIRIKYFESITCSDDGDLDGRHIPNRREIWIATGGRDAGHVADVLWHEAAAHMTMAYVEDDAAEESLALMMELTQPAILRSNPWFWRLFGGE